MTQHIHSNISFLAVVKAIILLKSRFAEEIRIVKCVRQCVRNIVFMYYLKLSESCLGCMS